jgi:hypothetical protein
MLSLFLSQNPNPNLDKRDPETNLCSPHACSAYGAFHLPESREQVWEEQSAWVLILAVPLGRLPCHNSFLAKACCETLGLAP